MAVTRHTAGVTGTRTQTCTDHRHGDAPRTDKTISFPCLGPLYSPWGNGTPTSIGDLLGGSTPARRALSQTHPHLTSSFTAWESMFGSQLLPEVGQAVSRGPACVCPMKEKPSLKTPKSEFLWVDRRFRASATHWKWRRELEAPGARPSRILTQLLGHIPCRGSDLLGCSECGRG